MLNRTQSGCTLESGREGKKGWFHRSGGDRGEVSSIGKCETRLVSPVESRGVHLPIDGSGIASLLFYRQSGDAPVGSRDGPQKTKDRALAFAAARNEKFGHQTTAAMFSSFSPGNIGITVSLREGLALAERHGFGGYDASLAELHDEVVVHGPASVRALFVQHGLRFGAWNLPFMPCRVGEDEWRGWLARLPALLHSAQAVGALRAGMWILPGSDDLAFDDNFAFHVRRFQPVAQLLAAHDIRLGLEFVGPATARRSFRNPFVHTVAGITELARAIGPNCGLLLDAWHWHCAGAARAELSALTREFLVHVHVNDAPRDVPRVELVDHRRKLPGATGVIDLDGFMQALAASGYDGPVTAEPFDPDINAMPAEEAVARTARATRAAVARALRAPERGSG